jgi:multiple sugar transport system substrate-binding protein
VKERAIKGNQRLRVISLLVLVLLVQACGGGTTPAAEPLLTATALPLTLTDLPQQGITPTPVITKPLSGIITLKIWLPPQFDPAAGTSTSELLKKRLQAFESRYENVNIETRVKALDGPGGLLVSLSAASAASPLALPDLVMLSRADLESAALKGLVQPLDGLTDILKEDDWYDYARQIAKVQNSIFGLPFGGDALLMVFRPSMVAFPPLTWEDSFALEIPLAFAASDSQALLLLAIYQSFGGVVQDEQGRPFLNETLLVEALSILQQAAALDVFPYWLTQYEESAQVWQAFLNRQVQLGVVWSSDYLTSATNSESGLSATLLPGNGEHSYTLARGWVWAVVSSDAERRDLGLRLAEFLVEGQFLASWSAANGLLPTRVSAALPWPNASSRGLVGNLALSASALPPVDILASLGPVLKNATEQVLKGQVNPQQAAKSAVDKLLPPP